MNIEVIEQRDGDGLILMPVDRLDSGNARSFESILMGFITSGERQVVVDFSRLEFVSSAGLRALLLAAKALKTGEGIIVMCGMKAHIETTVRTSGLQWLIPIEQSREAALETASAPSKLDGPSRRS